MSSKFPIPIVAASCASLLGTFVGCSGKMLPRDSTATVSTAIDGTSTYRSAQEHLRGQQARPQPRSAAISRPDSVSVIFVDIARTWSAWSPGGRLLWRLPESQLGAPATDIDAAADGTVYVRTMKSLKALGVDGEIRWSKPMPSPVDNSAMYAPEALADSGVVVVVKPTHVVGFSHKGERTWNFYFVGDERLIARARMSPNGEILLLTNRRLMHLHPNGRLAWQNEEFTPTVDRSP